MVALIAHLRNIPLWNIPWLRKLRICGTSKNTDKELDIPQLRNFHNYGIFHRFVDGIFHGIANYASVEYSTMEYSTVVQIVELWNIPEFFLNFFLNFKAESFKLEPKPLISIQTCSRRSQTKYRRTWRLRSFSCSPAANLLLQLILSLCPCFVSGPSLPGYCLCSPLPSQLLALI